MKRTIYANSAHQLKEKAEALIDHFFEFGWYRIHHTTGRKFEICFSWAWQHGYNTRVKLFLGMGSKSIYDQRLKKALLHISRKDSDLFEDTFREIAEKVHNVEILNCVTIIDYCEGRGIELDGYKIVNGQFVDEGSVYTCEHCSEVFSTDISDDYVFIDNCIFCCEDCAREGGYVMLHNGDWCHIDYVCYVESEGEYYHVDDCYYWESDGEHHLEPEPEENEGIYGYHDGPDPEYIACAHSDYTVGFEVEKTESPAEYSRHSFDGGFFAHWEEDSSCGYEGVSNIFPCNNWEAVEYSMSAGEAWHINNLDTDITCGGHINIAGPKINYHTVAKFIPLFYALYRYRLKNSYCDNGKKAKNKTSEKYSTFREKGDGVVEIRLPSRVHSVEQLKNRYELVSLMVDCIHHNKEFSDFSQMSTTILLSMYNGSVKKVKEVLTLAGYFKDWIDNDIVHPDIEEFIN